MPRPSWLKTRLPSGETSRDVDALLGRLKLHTVCSSARCPNLGECWGRGIATFMILGDVCTRHCRFCAVRTGTPEGPPDKTEPERIAEAVRELKLKYVVVTSVDRDDLPDFGAGAFAATIRALKNPAADNPAPSAARNPQSQIPNPQSSISNLQSPISNIQFPEVPTLQPRVEVLTPDFAARRELLDLVLSVQPDVFAHNIEVVEELTRRVRDPRASYSLSLQTLALAKKINPAQVTKSGLMVGLGETSEQVVRALRDLKDVGVDIVTIGQYLRPTRMNLPVVEYVVPAQFDEYARMARDLGFHAVLSAPLVRSSYHAWEQWSSDPVAE